MRCTKNIPVSLCEFALVNRKVNEVKLYIHLKLISDGYVEYSKESVKKWSRSIGVSSKTVESCIKWLSKKKWITFNGKKSVVHVIGYRGLAKKLRVNMSTGVLVDISNVREYRGFKALCCAIAITYYLRMKRYFDRRSERKNGRSITNRSKVKGYCPMANSYLAKCLGVSIATACRFKHQAEKFGHIETKSNYAFLETCKGERIDITAFDLIKSESSKEGLPNKFRKGRKYIKEIASDLIKSVLVCKKKRFK